MQRTTSRLQTYGDSEGVRSCEVLQPPSPVYTSLRPPKGLEPFVIIDEGCRLVRLQVPHACILADESIRLALGNFIGQYVPVNQCPNPPVRFASWCLVLQFPLRCAPHIMPLRAQGDGIL